MQGLFTSTLLLACFCELIYLGFVSLCFYLLKCFSCISGHEVIWHIWSLQCVASEGNPFFSKDSNADYVVRTDLCLVKNRLVTPALCTLLYSVYCNLGGSCHIEFPHYPLCTARLRGSRHWMWYKTSLRLSSHTVLILWISINCQNSNFRDHFTEWAKSQTSMCTKSKTLMTPVMVSVTWCVIQRQNH